MTGEPRLINPFLELTKTRLREFFREPGMLFWVFGFPLIMAIGLGLAFRDRPAQAPRVAVVASGDAAPLRALLASDRVHAERMSSAEAERSLARTKIDLIVAPSKSGFVMHFDSTQDRGRIARLLVADVLQRAAGRNDPLKLQERELKELGARYIDFLIPGLLGLNVMGSSMWGVGYSLVIQRKRRLLRRYAVTPMRRSHFLLSYFMARSSFLVLEISVLIAFGALAFGTIVRGSYATLALLSALGAASFAGVSLLIGARVDNTETANGWMNFVQLPMWILSGSFFSYERFPEWLHRPIRALPLTALNDALRAVYNEGAGVVGCWSECLVLAVWGALGFAVAIKTFRWQ